MRSDVFSAVIVFWIVIPISFVGAYRRFGGIYWIHLLSGYRRIGENCCLILQG
jgi:hypothetical protein